MRRRPMIMLLLAGSTALAAGRAIGLAGAAGQPAGGFTVSHSEAEWRQLLSPAAYDVLRDHGTEPPGSSPLDHEQRAGLYHCAGCDLALYDAATKFDSGTGWPSFFQPLPDAIGTSSDRSLLFMLRTEVHCSRCGGHLGHVFDDGPPPTGLRYCMNGVAMTFKPAAVG